MDKLTNQEFVYRLSQITNDIEPLEEYININTKIQFKCHICGNIFYTTPDSVLRGHKCRNCINIDSTYTKEQVQEKIDKFNTGIKIIGDYINTTTPVLVQCTHGHAYYTKAELLLTGCGCRICKNQKSKKTHDDYLNELKQKNTLITPLEKYNGARTKIKHKCNQCGYIWDALPTNILRNHKCPQCYRNQRLKTEQEFVQELNQKKPNILLDGEFKTYTEKTKFKCKVCGYSWYQIPSHILSSDKGCYKCGKIRTGLKLRLTNDEFIKKLYKINPNIEPLETYQNSKIKILVRCLKCKHEWKTKPNALLNYVGCPVCCESVGERIIRNFFNEHNIDFESQKKFNNLRGFHNGLLSYDFFVPKYNLLIEYQGQQHYHPIDFFGGQQAFECQQFNDNCKRDYAKINNFSLLEIKYDQNIIEQLQFLL